MIVLTLNTEDIEKCCEELLSKVENDGFNPDLVLAIRTGGAEVGRIFKNYLPEGCAYLECSTHRQTSKIKKKYLKNILSRLPRPILDRLRIFEASTFKSKSRREIERVELPEGISNYKRILILDDAIDSGATIDAVRKAVSAQAPHASIKIATVTVTSMVPDMVADYYIYRDGSLIRFPWSMDAKKQ